MVLEESSDDRDVFRRDDVPPSDEPKSTRAATRMIHTQGVTTSDAVTEASAKTTPNELYINFRVSGGPLRQYQIPFDRMPLQGFARTAAFGSPGLTARTSHSLIGLMATMETLNGRPLTQTEAEGVALHVGRRQIYSLIPFSSGLIFGGAIAFASRKIFRFPFRKPKSVERYNMFPLVRAPLLTGHHARQAWHMTRTFAWVGISWLFLIPFCEFLGGNAQAVHLLKDERTSKLVQDAGRSIQKAHQKMQADRKEKTGQKWRGTPENQGSGKAPFPPDQAETDSSGSGDYYGSSQGGFVQDSGSPTSSQDSYSNPTSNTDILSDAQMHPHNRRSQSSSTYSSDPSNRSTFEVEKVERQPRSFDSEYNPSNDSSSSSSSSYFDDASPTAGNDPPTPPPPHLAAPAHGHDSASPQPPTPIQTSHHHPPHLLHP